MEKRPMDINLVTNKWKNYKKIKVLKPTIDPVSIVKAKPPPLLKRKETSLLLDKKAKNKEIGENGKKGNWKKVFAFSKFISLAKSQSEQEPANLVVGGRYHFFI